MSMTCRSRVKRRTIRRRRKAIMVKESIEGMLTGGHPNSLGRTVEVVNLVLSGKRQFDKLFNCYQSDDEVVRLRVSNALKRVESEQHDMLLPYVDRLIDEVGDINQASAQWTLAQLFERLFDDMTTSQRKRALKIVKRNLKSHDDWIVLNDSIEMLSNLAQEEAVLKRWLRPHLERLSADGHKSVSSRALKKFNLLYGDQ